MKLSQALQMKEEWEDSFNYKQNGPPRTIEVFKNPSTKEMDEASKKVQGKSYIRWIAHKGTFYVFDPSVYHSDASLHLKLGIEVGPKHGIFWGTAVKTRKGWKFEGSDTNYFDKVRPPKYIEKWIIVPDDAEYNKRSTNPNEFGIKEEWENSIKIDGETLDIFVNPSQKELREAGGKRKEIRWMSDNKTKKLYVWYVGGLIHVDMGRKLGFFKNPYDYLSTQKRFIGGTATLRNGKFITDDSHIVRYGWQKYDEKDLKSYLWIEKYINIDYIKKIIGKSIERKKKMNEEWVDSFQYSTNGPNRTIEIFKNPSTKEMMEVSEEYKGARYIRFIASKNGDLYVFNPTVYHTDVAEQLNFVMSPGSTKDFWGTAFKKGSAKWEYEGSDSHYHRTIPKFVDKWIKIKETTNDSLNPYNIHQRKKKLKEEWADSFKLFGRGPGKATSKSKTIEIFVNPTAKEMLEVKEENSIRFIANYRDKKVYVFSPNVIHNEVAEKLGISKGMEDYFNDTKLLGGVGELKNGKFRLEDIPHNLRIFGRTPNEQLIKASRDWSFVDKYIAGTSTFVERIKKGFEKNIKRQKARAMIREQYEL